MRYRTAAGMLFALIILAGTGADSVAVTTPGVTFEPVAYPSYADYKGIQRYAPTAQAYQAAIDDQRFVMERVGYPSDGLRVYAYLYRPRHVPDGSRLPAVIFNRGSYTRGDFSPEVLMPARRLAEHGYVVIAPMLRGSGDAAGHDEMGGADVHDIFNIVPVLRDLGYVDVDRLFLYGESRGAIMSMIAARDHFPARAIAVYGLTADLSSQLAEGTPGRAIASSIWPDFATQQKKIIEERSPIRWLDRISTPVLLMNGSDDGSVSPTNALDLARELGRLGKPYELKIFHGEKHVLAGRAAERDADAVRWFKRFDLKAH